MAIYSKRKGDFGDYAIYLLIYCRLLKGNECTLCIGVEIN